MRKKKLLFVTEWHKLSTGYATYTKNLLSRLYKTGKYDIIELASYGSQQDPKLNEGVPWKVIGNNPLSKEEEQAYHSNPVNQLGAFRFNDVAINEMPDCVLDFRDEWYFSYEGTSILRPNYHWIVQPTVDAVPQAENWQFTFSLADHILTYTDFGKRTLESVGFKNVRGVAFLGADFETFFPHKDKKAVRQFYGVDPNINLIGFVSRNQPRKLYPDLFIGFKKFLETTTPELAKKTFLVIHSSFPDQQPWDFPRLIKNLGISHKVLFTYICHSCHNISLKPWQDIKSLCSKCNAYNAKLPNNILGVNNQQLNDIYNMMDIYVQYANSEGIGIGQLEAASCGIPLIAVNYSGMEDVVKKLGAYPVNYHKLTCEVATMCMRAVPNDDHFAEQLNKFFQLPEDMRRKRSENTLKLAKEVCDWDKCAAEWDRVIDMCPIRPIMSTWGRKPRIHQPQTQIPANLSPQQLVNYLILNVLGMPEYSKTYFEMDLVYKVSNDLVNPQQLIDEFYKACMNNNYLEERRYKTFLEKAK